MRSELPGETILAAVQALIFQPPRKTCFFRHLCFERMDIAKHRDARRLTRRAYLMEHNKTIYTLWWFVVATESDRETYMLCI